MRRRFHTIPVASPEQRAIFELKPGETMGNFGDSPIYMCGGCGYVIQRGDGPTYGHIYAKCPECGAFNDLGAWEDVKPPPPPPRKAAKAKKRGR